MFDGYTNEELEQMEILTKYAGYIKNEQENVEKLLRLENYKLDKNIDYNSLTSLSLEARDKLSTIQPQNIGQATRISGVSPADISVLLVHFGR